MAKSKFFLGFCYLYIDQGYEGLPWAFQDRRYIFEDGSRSWDGLHVILPGDELIIYSKENPKEIVWSGVIKFTNNRLYRVKSQQGVNPEIWRKWFREEFSAKLIPRNK